jgi:IS605 OrfB family transposase
VATVAPYSIRTVVVPQRLEPALVRALSDVHSAVNHLIVDWIAHPEEPRFEATRRSYPLLRRIYPHLAADWAVTMANETSAVRNAWNHSLRRARRQDPERFERMRWSRPNRRIRKASLHPGLFRWEPTLRVLDITVRPSHHSRISLAGTTHPLFWRYGEASEWHFGLTLRPNALLFHFRVPRAVEAPEGAVGIALNFDSAQLASSDGRMDRVDLRPITRIQEQAFRMRQAIQRHISKDLRHQRAVLRRYHHRETHRVLPLLHRAANELLAKADSRALVFEDLTELTSTVLRREYGRRAPESRRRLSAWTHGRLSEIVSYKAHTPTIWVNPEGTSQECPQCGGHLALPSRGRVLASGNRKRMTRQVFCGECGGRWHRDATAAIAVLARGLRILRGDTIPPSARSALLEAAAWRPDLSDRETGRWGLGPTAEPMNADDANSEDPSRSPDR